MKRGIRKKSDVVMVPAIKSDTLTTQTVKITQLLLHQLIQSGGTSEEATVLHMRHKSLHN